MSFISQPAANLHSPGAIGDVSRGSGAFEPLNAFGQAVFWDGLDVKFTNTLNIQSGTMYLNSSGIGMNASKILTWGPDAGVVSSSPDIGLARPAIGVLKVTDGSSGYGFVRAKLSTDTAATTGLVAGVFAATTTATLRVYDVNGTAYKVAALPE